MVYVTQIRERKDHKLKPKRKKKGPQYKERQVDDYKQRVNFKDSILFLHPQSIVSVTRMELLLSNHTYIAWLKRLAKRAGS